MNFKEFYFGMRDFKDITTEDSIKDILKCSKKTRRDEITNPRRVIVMFESEEARSLLIFTNTRVYKIFDDRNKTIPILNWSISLDEFAKQTNTSGIAYFPNDKELEYAIFPNEPDKRYLFEKIRFQLIDLKTQIKFLANNSTKSIDDLVKEHITKM